jgi:hypothetical protein
MRKEEQEQGWQRSQAPTDKTTYRLNCKIKEERDKSINYYITSLNRFDNTVWKPIKYLKNPRHRYIQ